MTIIAQAGSKALHDGESDGRIDARSFAPVPRPSRNNPFVGAVRAKTRELSRAYRLGYHYGFESVIAERRSTGEEF